MRSRPHTTAVLTLTLVAALGFVRTASGQTAAAWPTRTWARADPQEHGLDTQKLQVLVDLIRENRSVKDLHSLLIVRNGYLVTEEYFAGWTADRLHMQQSVTKSFTSALVGIAIEQGKIQGVDEKVWEFFPNLDLQTNDGRKRAMRLEDLLTMRSGTDYHERGNDSPHSTLNRKSRGWTRFILDRPMIAAPGTKFQYDSGAVILTSAILQNRTGSHADIYAEPNLFEPLGIERTRWFRNSEGHPHTGGGLDLRPRDMAKFGLLYIRKGRWEGRQVVPETWVEDSFHQHVDLEGRGHTIGYGYWWWISEPDPEGDGATAIYSARGFRAQYIFVIPEHNMVVVFTGGTRQWEDEKRPVELLYSHILPSVRR